MRTKIATFDKYGDAQNAKHELIVKFPDKIFQVRNKSGVYLLVERTYPSSNAETTSARKEKKRGITD